jgi:transcriptional regulator of arginine metabolism
MGITRDRGPDGPIYRIDNNARYMTVLRQVVGMEIRSVRHNASLVVIHTLQGRAGGVAGFLDGWDNPHILGTIAGDDTVFVAPTPHVDCETLAAEIRSLSSSEQELM